MSRSASPSYRVSGSNAPRASHQRVLPNARPISKAFAFASMVFGGTSFFTAASRDSAFKGIDHEAAPRITTFWARLLPASAAIRSASIRQGANRATARRSQFL